MFLLPDVTIAMLVVTVHCKAMSLSRCLVGSLSLHPIVRLCPIARLCFRPPLVRRCRMSRYRFYAIRSNV